MGVVVVFAFLDAFYLALERAYQRLYADVAAGRNNQPWTLDDGGVNPKHVLLGLTGAGVSVLHGASLAGALIVACST